MTCVDVEVEDVEYDDDGFFVYGPLDEKSKLEYYMKSYIDEKKLFNELSTETHINNMFNEYGSTVHEYFGQFHGQSLYFNEENIGRKINCFLKSCNESNITIVEIGAGTGANTKHIVSKLSKDIVSTYITTDAFYKPKLPYHEPESMRTDVSSTDIELKTAKLNIFDSINKISTDSSITNACLFICCPPPIDGCKISLDVMSLVESIDISKIKYIFILRYGERYCWLDGTYDFMSHFKFLSKYWKMSIFNKVTGHLFDKAVYRNLYMFKRTID